MPYEGMGGPPVDGYVLVVDDDADLRAVIRAVLEDEGIAVETAATGVRALARIHEQPPAVVLLDLQMPVMDGWQLHRRMRELGVQSRVIYMTGWRLARTEAARYGADGYLAKPFDFDDLVALVLRHLER
jgi:DNA-binding response OmpR family regulator